MNSFELLLCIALIFVSAYLAASEIALFSLSRFQIRSMRERLRSSHKKIKRLLADPGGLLITILVINEVVNVALSALIASSVAGQGTLPTFGLPAWVVNTVAGMLITAPIVLFFCEITPKVIAARANQLIAALTVGPLSIVYDAFKPVRVLLRWVTGLVTRVAGPPDAHGGRGGGILKESEFLLMLEEGHREGAIQGSELDLIRKVFELDDTTVAEICTPIAQVRSLSVHTTLKGALAAMKGQSYSRIPVIGEKRREVVGILYAKDLLRAKVEPELLPATVGEIMRKPMFVPPTMRLNALFRRFKQQRMHMAVVQGPRRDTVGVVTMSDLLDELFEDLLPDEDETNATFEGAG